MHLIYVMEMHMRTTLNLNEDLITESMELSGISNKTKVIELALHDFVRKMKRKKIKQSCGKLKLDVDIMKLREKELHE
jgi:Arc/MetJ family transcription regulator